MEVLSNDLDKNIRALSEIFRNCGDVISRKIPFGQSRDIFFYVIYIDALVDRELIETQIINALMHKVSFNYFVLQNDSSETDLKNLHDLSEKKFEESKINIFNEFKNYAMTTADIKEANNLKDISVSVMSGETALLIDGYDTALIVSNKKFPLRGVSNTEIEPVIYGSKDAFTESIRYNTALIRRRIRDTNLRIEQFKLGKRSNTDIAIVYIEDIAHKKLIENIKSKLKQINIDAILDANYINEFIEKNHNSVFPQTQITERPDKTASALLEGRVALLVDNTPFVLIIPAILVTFFQASEDYYDRWQIMSFLRIIRYITAFFSITLPGIFIALTLYHPNVLPLRLVLKLADERKNVPMSTLFEILVMELAFDLLIEATIRLPNPIGNSLGIFGGIIVGQAAVSAGLVTPIVIIVVSLTAIASFTVPNTSFVSALRLLKYPFIIASAMFGIFGLYLSIIIMLIHLTSLDSFGVPYLYPFVSGEVNNFNDLKDTLFRIPIFKMKKRPIFASRSQKIRQSD
jgi:spore germination protein